MYTSCSTKMAANIAHNHTNPRFCPSDCFITEQKPIKYTLSDQFSILASFSDFANSPHQGYYSFPPPNSTRDSSSHQTFWPSTVDAWLKPMVHQKRRENYKEWKVIVRMLYASISSVVVPMLQMVTLGVFFCCWCWWGFRTEGLMEGEHRKCLYLFGTGFKGRDSEYDLPRCIEPLGFV